MRQPFLHLSRDSAQMFSGAAGLVAAFAAVSLPILVSQNGAASRMIMSRGIMVPALMLCLGFVASGLLRFSLMRDHSASGLRSHGVTAEMHSLDSSNGR